jgi:hypothetical protein
MKTAFLAIPLLAAAVLLSAHAAEGQSRTAEAQQVPVPASKWQVTREQKRQEAIDMLRSGVPNGGEGYQSQLPPIGQ